MSTRRKRHRVKGKGSKSNGFRDEAFFDENLKNGKNSKSENNDTNGKTTDLNKNTKQKNKGNHSKLDTKGNNNNSNNNNNNNYSRDKNIGKKSTNLIPCRYWIQGQCQFGDRCHYLHTRIQNGGKKKSNNSKLNQNGNIGTKRRHGGAIKKHNGERIKPTTVFPIKDVSHIIKRRNEQAKNNNNPKRLLNGMNHFNYNNGGMNNNNNNNNNNNVNTKSDTSNAWRSRAPQIITQRTQNQGNHNTTMNNNNNNINNTNSNRNNGLKNGLIHKNNNGRIPPKVSRSINNGISNAVNGSNSVNIGDNVNNSNNHTNIGRIDIVNGENREQALQKLNQTLEKLNGDLENHVSSSGCKKITEVSQSSQTSQMSLSTISQVPSLPHSTFSSQTQNTNRTFTSSNSINNNSNINSNINSNVNVNMNTNMNMNINMNTPVMGNIAGMGISSPVICKNLTNMQIGSNDINKIVGNGNNRNGNGNGNMNVNSPSPNTLQNRMNGAGPPQVNNGQIVQTPQRSRPPLQRMPITSTTPSQQLQSPQIQLVQQSSQPASQHSSAQIQAQIQGQTQSKSQPPQAPQPLPQQQSLSPPQEGKIIEEERIKPVMSQTAPVTPLSNRQQQQLPQLLPLQNSPQNQAQIQTQFQQQAQVQAQAQLAQTQAQQQSGAAPNSLISNPLLKTPLSNGVNPIGPSSVRTPLASPLKLVGNMNNNSLAFTSPLALTVNTNSNNTSNNNSNNTTGNITSNTSNSNNNGGIPSLANPIANNSSSLLTQTPVQTPSLQTPLSTQATQDTQAMIQRMQQPMHHAAQTNQILNQLGLSNVNLAQQMQNQILSNSQTPIPIAMTPQAQLQAAAVLQQQLNLSNAASIHAMATAAATGNVAPNLYNNLSNINGNNFLNNLNGNPYYNYNNSYNGYNHQNGYFDEYYDEYYDDDEDDGIYDEDFVDPDELLEIVDDNGQTLYFRSCDAIDLHGGGSSGNGGRPPAPYTGPHPGPPHTYPYPVGSGGAGGGAGGGGSSGNGRNIRRGFGNGGESYGMAITQDDKRTPNGKKSSNGNSNGNNVNSTNSNKKKFASKMYAKMAAKGTIAVSVPKASPPKDTDETIKICTHFLAGNCHYGDTCHYAHRFPNPWCPNCLLEIGTNVDKQKQHMEDCKAKEEMRNERKESQSATCGICHENPLQCHPNRKFGLLEGCNHTFCLKCIREWRGTTRQSKEMIRSCPMCRALSHFVIPSTTMVTNPQRKAKVIQAYKQHLAEIPCRFFDETQECPFGTSCFYKHVNPDGTVAKVTLRHLHNADGKIEIAKSFKLSDFLFQGDM